MQTNCKTIFQPNEKRVRILLISLFYELGKTVVKKRDPILGFSIWKKEEYSLGLL